MIKTIEAAIRDGRIVDLLRNAPVPPFAMPRQAPECTNWADEQMSWRKAACLYDQSHHMTDLTLTGADALEVIGRVAVNSFAKFPVDTAKQFVAVNPDGYMVGDAIIFHMTEGEYRVVGGPPAIDWLHFHAATGGYDLTVARDDNSYVRHGDPELYRYQVQGPQALEVMRKVLGGEPPALRFFAMTTVTIAGAQVRALRHGMAGEAGYELFGPWKDNAVVLAAIMEAGAELGIRRVGGLAYLTNTLESGWIPRPMPAIYGATELMEKYRAWLAARGSPPLPSLGGSFASASVSDYYIAPFDLDYGKIIRFDHDFIGRQALERMIAEGRDQARTKVTLLWNGEDVARAVGSAFAPGLGAKIMNLPMPLYATLQYDRVQRAGKDVGLSLWAGYSANERAMLSLAIVDSAVAVPGSEVVLYWGESPNTRKPTVEPHQQVTIRATVAPVPIADFARTGYRSRSSPA